MKTKSIKAILLSISLFSSITLFVSCSDSKSEENQGIEVAENAETKISEAVSENANEVAEVVKETADETSEVAKEAVNKATQELKTEAKEIATKVEKNLKNEMAAGVNSVAQATEAKPNLSFDKPTHDFGTIQQGDVIEHVFTFRNTGNAPLVISSAKPSCGCTVPSWPQEPIMPGETGEIKAAFNSSHKSGPQNKSIRVFTNADEQPVVITLKGNINIPVKE